MRGVLTRTTGTMNTLPLPNALAEHWSTQQLMDLVFTVGQYNLVSMALNSFGVQPEPGLPAMAD